MALLASLYLSALRVGVGLHWPSDILAGGLIGTLVTLLCLPLEPMLARWLHPIALQFEAHPRWAYALGFLAMLDLSQQFAATQALLQLVTH
jgi:undecaprenyl-diphosphatase